MTQNQTYIYYDKRTDDMTQTKVTGTRIYHYDAAPNTHLAGIHLSVNNVRQVTLYQGENAMAQPITEVISVAADGVNLFLLFDARTFGNTDADRLLIGLTADGTNTPAIADIDFFGTMLAFPDGFFDKIIPTRTDRSGGVIELVDGTFVQYKGVGSQKWRWTLGAKFVNKQMMDKLERLYTERPEFYFAQEPARYPERIYRCILENPIFRVPYTSQWKGNGYSIEMEVAEM